MFRKLLFFIVRRIVLKYFREGLKAIGGSASYNKPIAWQWTFYDEKYEKYKNRKI